LLITNDKLYASRGASIEWYSVRWFWGMGSF
jgi:hypothetical protein